jgi:N-methylhydantoinase B/oxoprolinase/acetone carboxylase alpha subunit
VTSDARSLGPLTRHGTDTLFAAMDEILDRSETAMREAIRAIPDGIYSFEYHLYDCWPNA